VAPPPVAVCLPDDSSETTSSLLLGGSGDLGPSRNRLVNFLRYRPLRDWRAAVSLFPSFISTLCFPLSLLPRYPSQQFNGANFAPFGASLRNDLEPLHFALFLSGCRLEFSSGFRPSPTTLDCVLPRFSILLWLFCTGVRYYLPSPFSIFAPPPFPLFEGLLSN